TGPADAQGVQLSDALPAATTFVSFTAPAGWTASMPPVGGTGSVTAARPTLAAGSGPQVFTLVVRVNPDTPDTSTLDNTARVTSRVTTITNPHWIATLTTTADPNPDNNAASLTTTVNTQADLAITETDSPDPVAAGSDLTYTLTVQNNGPSDAQDVALGATLPANTTLVSFTA